MPVDSLPQVGSVPLRPLETRRPMPAQVQAPTGGNASRQGQEPTVLGQVLTPAVARQADPGASLQVAGRANEYVQTLRRELVFKLDKETDRVIVTVVDPETGEVIRQIPSEEALAVARALSQVREGLLLNTRV